MICFGSIADELYQIKTLGTQRHRETEKEKLKILDISKNTSLFEFKDTIKKIASEVSACIGKFKSSYNMSIYSLENVDNNKYIKCNIIPEKILKSSENEICMYRINLDEEVPIIYFTNSIYYNNYNKTLPIGMNVTSEALIDTSKLKLELTETKELLMNTYDGLKEDFENPKSIKLRVYEYIAKNI